MIFLGRPNEFLGLGGSNQTGESLRPARPGKNRQRGFGQAQTGPRGHDSQIRRQSQFQASPQGHPVHRGNHRHGEFRHLLHRAAQEGHKGSGFVLVHGGTFLQIGARGKDAFRTGRQHDTPTIRGVGGIQVIQTVLEFRKELSAHGIGFLGTIEGEFGNGSGSFITVVCSSAILG